ncbi:condensation domain-containing protein [Actinocrispum wychmicini]|uniref:Phosphopantetheine binding protein n=1 Tax=Actinocrispum wychmicini TaxID=1213861 RepID=A0A4R2J8B5_9PSEU|nr:condensation domain-containing protein [Actinocrispum wychmicini]TCO54854.1 phosphopantetheine binding protein [Actinocrispum wychmicini]
MADTTPAAGPLEASLLRICSEHLDLDGIHPSDDLFELGADSLTAIRITTAVRAQHGPDLPGDLVFRFPTVAKLFAYLGANGGTATSPEPVAARRSSAVPLTYSQERMWLLHELAGDQVAGNVVVRFDVTGRFDFDALRSAFETLARRHDVLRMTFHEKDSTVTGVVGQADVPVRMWAGEERVRELVSAGATSRYDLSAAPPWSVSVIRRGPADHVILLNYHQILLDAWGLEVLLAELGECYSGRSPDLSPVRRGIADVAREWREWTDTPVAGERLDHWLRSLAGAPERLDFATARRRPGIRDGRGRAETFEVDDDLTARLRLAARQRGHTVFPLLLTGFAQMLHSYTGTGDLVIGVPFANRLRPGSERVVGCLVNMLPVRVRVPVGSSGADVLDAVLQAMLAAHADQEIALETIVEHLRPNRTVEHAPVFQVSFGFEPPALTRLRLAGASVAGSFVPTGRARFDLAMMLTPASGGYEGCAEYATDLLDQATVREMIAAWRTAVHSLLNGL